MCYSNCKNENWEGECKSSKRDEFCHCFDGFTCTDCLDICQEDDESKVENVCHNCFQENQYIKCETCGKLTPLEDLDFGRCEDC